MNLPNISLLIPVRNEEKYIGSCLDRIFQQVGVDGSLEILIADGMSTDNTRKIIQCYQKVHSNLILIDNPGKIVSTGLNLAIRQARGDIIIRVDGHCEIAKNYITNCLGHLSHDRVDGVGGPMQTIGETPLSETIAVAMSSPFGVGGSAFRTVIGKTMLADSVPFPAYTRKIIEQVGLYDEELVRNQDDEYNYRIREFGGKILLAADVQSVYYSRGSLEKLWKQYYQYGYWKVRVLQKHPRQMSLRQFVPPAFVLAILAALILIIIFPWGWISPVFVAGCYILANFAASILTASQRGWQHLPLLPVTFSILHLSYGCGFLVGLVRFANRWENKKGKVPTKMTDNA